MPLGKDAKNSCSSTSASGVSFAGLPRSRWLPVASRRTRRGASWGKLLKSDPWTPANLACTMPACAITFSRLCKVLSCKCTPFGRFTSKCKHELCRLDLAIFELRVLPSDVLDVEPITICEAVVHL